MNDLGFLRRADEIPQNSWFQIRWDKPGRYMRNIRLNFNQWSKHNFDGDRLSLGGNINSHWSSRTTGAPAAASTSTRGTSTIASPAAGLAATGGPTSTAGSTSAPTTAGWSASTGTSTSTATSRSHGFAVEPRVLFGRRRRSRLSSASLTTTASATRSG